MNNNNEDTETAKSKSTIKIVDRRRFDSDGDEKPAGSDTATQIPIQHEIPVASQKSQTLKTPEHSSSQVKEQNMETKPNTKDSSIINEEVQDNHEEPGDISFESFVLSLATQAMMLLGQIRPPDGVPLAVDPEAAKQSIDILSMLDIKTKGNLNAQESQLLKDALHNLRISYLKFS